MNRNFARSLSAVLKYEGGYVDHPADPGGATNMGITIGTLSAWLGRKATKVEVKALTIADVTPIYRKNYWDLIRGDDLPIGIDLSTFDYGVNSGPSRSVKDLQRVLGVAEDGAVGPVTLKAAVLADRRAAVKAHCARRLSFVRSLAIWNTFGKGWSARIVAVEALALSWVSTKAQLEADAKAARGTAAGQATGAVATVGTGTADQVNGLSGLPIGWVIAGIAVIVAVLAVRTIINAQRAGALALVAKEA